VSTGGTSSGTGEKMQGRIEDRVQVIPGILRRFPKGGRKNEVGGILVGPLGRPIRREGILGGP